MTDVHTPQQRSFNMSRIRNSHTKPEMKVRLIAHGLGFRYRLHQKNLPGKPDLVFAGKKKIIFVHGCFWHMHNCKYGNVTPKTNEEFWNKKRSRNVERDRLNLKACRAAGYKTLIIWECETRDVDALKKKISKFLLKQSIPKVALP